MALENEVADILFNLLKSWDTEPEYRGWLRTRLTEFFQGVSSGEECLPDRESPELEDTGVGEEIAGEAA